MAYWSPLVIEGVRYDLSHLEPFQFQVTPREMSGPATINVRFHDHCFTTAYDTKKHLEITRSNQHSAREERTFDLNRYELSKLLPDFIKAWTERGLHPVDMATSSGLNWLQAAYTPSSLPFGA
jgi:hypothetical protein